MRYRNIFKQRPYTKCIVHGSLLKHRNWHSATRVNNDNCCSADHNDSSDIFKHLIFYNIISVFVFDNTMRYSIVVHSVINISCIKIKVSAQCFISESGNFSLRVYLPSPHHVSKYLQHIYQSGQLLFPVFALIHSFLINRICCMCIRPYLLQCYHF